MKNLFFKIAFIALLAVVFVFGLGSYLTETAHAQGRGDLRRADQLIRDSTIDSSLLSPTLINSLVWESVNGNAPLADSAISLRLQRLTTGHFLATSADSLYKFLIDSADYARFLRNGAILGRSAFSETAFDSLQGNPGTNDYWILYALNSRHADSSDISDYAIDAGTAQQAVKYIGTDTIAAARFANVAAYADYAAATGAVFAEITDEQWAAIRDSIEDISGSLTQVDSAVLADTARSLRANAIQNLADFTTTMQNSYIPTANQKSALGRTYQGIGRGAGAALSSSNPPVDSTGLSKNFVPKYTTADIQIGYADHVNAKSAVIIDTSGDGGGKGAIRTLGVDNDSIVFKDSVAVAAMIEAASDLDSADYVLTGINGYPDRITTSSSTASGGSDNDLWVCTADTTLSVKIGGNWNAISGGGGGGVPLSVSTSDGTIDADSLVRTDVAFDNVMRGTYHVGGPIAIGATGDPSTMTVRDSSRIYSYGTIYAESLRATSPDDGYTGRQIFVSGQDTIVGQIKIGREGDVNNQPYIYARHLEVSGAFTAHYTDDSEFGSIYPSTESNEIGSLYTPGRWSDVNAVDIHLSNQGEDAPSFIVVDTVTNDQFQIVTTSGMQVTFAGAYVLFQNSDIVQSSGSITTPSVSISSGPSLSSTGINLNGGDYISMSTSSYINAPRGSQIKMKSDRGDSTIFYDVDDGAPFFVVNEDEKAALVEACPPIASDNPVISRDWMELLLKSQYVRADTMLTYKGALGRLTYVLYPDTCDDSLWAPFPQDEVLIPHTPALPWHDPQWGGDNAEIIAPWDIIPIDPPPPVEIVYTDSASGAFRINDPSPGYPEHIVSVSQRYNGEWGFVTGKYQTIQQALDSLPNYRCGYYLQNANGVAPDTFVLNTTGATAARQISAYRGDLRLATNIQDTLPEFIRQPGVWVKFEDTAFKARERWVQVDRWIDAQTFTTQDTVVASGAWSQSTTILTFAHKTIVDILPPVRGGIHVLDATIQIRDFCPVVLRGNMGRDNTILTNRGNTLPNFTTLFNVAVNETVVVTGMPIEFDGLTFYSDSVDAAGSAKMLTLGGRVKMKDCFLAIRQDIGGVAHRSYMVEYGGYTSNHRVDKDINSMIFERTVFVADSDCVPVLFNLDSISFTAHDCVFSVSGDDGAILYKALATPYNPSFTSCQFHTRTTNSEFADGIAAAAGDSVFCMGSMFVGMDPNTSEGSAEFSGGWKSFIKNVTNTYSASFTQAPPLATKGNAPIQLPFIPGQ